MDQPTTEKEFFAYVLLSLAYSDTELAPEEAELIKSKLSVGEFDTLHQNFKAHNDAQGLEYIRSGAKTFLNKEENRQRLKESMHELVHADAKVSQMETVVMNYLNRIIA
jgi:uncharacterized tellurite resistance protein B-like protein